MGRHRKRGEEERTCEIKDCENKAVRSLPIKKVEQYLTNGVKPGITRRVHICKDHYKEYKRESKDDRIADRLSWRPGGVDPQ